MGNRCSSVNELTVLTNIDTSKIEARTFAGQRRLAKVVDVYDGDTITIVCKLDKTETYRTYKLRLSGIDAPEKKPLKTIPNRDLHIAAAGKVTKLLTTKLGGIGSVVEVEFMQEEKFGRTMGTVWTIEQTTGCMSSTWHRKENVNEWLIQNSLVKAYSGDKKTDFTEVQLKNILANSIA